MGSMMLYGFSCTNALTSFRTTMRKPEDLSTALKHSHILAFGIYSAVAFSGYYAFGVETKPDILESLCTHDDDCMKDAGNRMVFFYILASAVVICMVVSLPFCFFILFNALEKKIDLL